MIASNVLKEDKIKSGLVSVVKVRDVTHDDGIKARQFSNFSVSSIFLKQVRHCVISKH